MQGLIVRLNTDGTGNGIGRWLWLNGQFGYESKDQTFIEDMKIIKKEGIYDPIYDEAIIFGSALFGEISNHLASYGYSLIDSDNVRDFADRFALSIDIVLASGNADQTDIGYVIDLKNSRIVGVWKYYSGKHVFDVSDFRFVSFISDKLGKEIEIPTLSVFTSGTYIDAYEKKQFDSLSLPEMRFVLANGEFTIVPAFGIEEFLVSSP